ncbi:MAG: VWA domain-containing protein [Cryomorphaceae bacterium]|jgi:uncharacterized protein YegL|nr:VWA domain-containing protein [Cryomorphaceae bacterium]
MEQARNTDQKCPVVLLLDTSGSMGDEVNGVMAINELNDALKSLHEEILSDPVLSQRLEVGIVCFDDDARVEKPIDLISAEGSFPELQPGGTTNVVAGINKAIEIIEERKAFYKSNNEAYYRPFIVLFTDGAPSNSEDEIEALDVQIQTMSDNKKFIFLPFGVGDADMSLLAKLAAQTSDQRLANKAIAYKMTNATKFKEVFEFVSASIGAAIGQGGAATTQLDPSVAQAVTFDLS